MEQDKVREILIQRFESSRGSFHKHPKTAVLSVACSDRDYRRALSDFHSRLERVGVDRIVEPGGPLIFHQQLTEQQGHAVERAEFLIQHHGIVYVLLFGHHACGAYAAKYAPLGWSQEQIDEQVKKDLLAVKAGLKAKYDGKLEVIPYFLMPNGDRVTFELI